MLPAASRTTSVALGLLIALAGCGEGPPPVPTVDGGGRRDAGRRDAGVDFDGGDFDGGDFDGGDFDGGDFDGGDLDGGSPDGGCSDPFGCDAGALGCRLEGRVADLGLDDRDFANRAIDVAYSGGAFWLAWAQSDGIVSTVQVYRWPLVGDPRKITLTPDRPNHRDVHLTPNADGGVTVAWVDNSGVGFQVYGQRVAPDGTPVGTASAWTTDFVTHQALDVVGVGGGFLASWTQSDGLGGPSAVAVRPSDGLLAPTAPVAVLDALAPGAVRTALVAADGGGALLAWSTFGDVSVAPLSAAGVPAGGSSILTTEHNGDGSVALAPGLAAFTVLEAGALPQIRVREVDGGGLPSGPERIVTLPPSSGVEPGVAVFDPGWLVAYRALPDGTLTVPTIRVAFVGSFGSPTPIFDLADTSRDGGPVTIATAPDGRIAVTWSERRPTELALFAARFVCD